MAQLSTRGKISNSSRMVFGLRWGCVWLTLVALICARSAPAGGSASLSLDAEPSPYRIEIHKSARHMQLWYGGTVLRSFVVALGKEPNGSKEMRGDYRTPVGRYYIVEKKPSRKFHRFLGLNYPNLQDAERALRRGWIDEPLWAEIFFADLNRTVPPQTTLLGGRVGIHGYGGRPELPIDWTEGCVAVRDAEIEYLYETLPLGTRVDILP